ncbi:MAG: bifunctional metallophosphatase/5'-nucleotidase [Victivallales bacterium]|nr:bifunctional metallophosphatase/5'-nucleotidase [Victivallales bacterium]
MRFIGYVLLWLLCAVFAMAEECVVRVLHTSDLHANLTGDALSPTSFAQLATVLRTLRHDAPGPVLHIDTGDTIEGTLAGALSRGRPILEALKLMGCDIWVPGNHEFDFGAQNFLELAARCPVTMLCGNLWRRGAMLWERYPAGIILHCGKARIAVIGLTASYLPNWYLGDFGEAFEVESAEATLRRILPDILLQKPDAIILGIHQGLTSRQNDPRGVNEVNRIAHLFPQIDLILGGHTHRAIPGRAVGHSWFLQPSAHGEFIGLAELHIDLDEHQVRRITSHLVQPIAETPADPAIQQFLAPVITAASALEAEVLHAPLRQEVKAKGRPGVSCPLSELLCQVLAEETGAEIALHGTLSTEGLPAGKAITGAELFTVVPYENTCVTAMVTAEELEAIFTEQWKQRKVYTYCGIWGAAVSVDSAEEAHVTGIGAELVPPEPGRRYRLVLNSHTAAGGGRTPVLSRILAREESQCTDTGRLTRDALRDWLLRHPEDFEIRPRPWIGVQRK